MSKKENVPKGKIFLLFKLIPHYRTRVSDAVPISSVVPGQE